jgi:hypothetical protein
MVVRKYCRIYEFGAVLWVLIFGKRFVPQEQLHLVLFLEPIVQFLFAQLSVQLLSI